MHRRLRSAAVLAVLALVVACIAAPAAADEEADAGADAGAEAAPPPVVKSCIPADACCKICDTGKACGKSCISRAKVCHKGRGCACDAASVCP